MSAGNRLRGDRAAADGLDRGDREELPASDVSMRSAWRTSSYSASNGACVEVAELQPDLIGVRDTKNAGRGPVLVFEVAAWRSFLDNVKRGT